MSPQLTLAEAADVLELHWALSGRLTELGSFEDQNFAVADATGNPGYVLNVNGPERSVSLELEHEILHRLAETGPPCDLPLPVPATSGAEIVKHGSDRLRLLRWVPGIPMADLPHQSPARLRELGELAGRLGTALAAIVPAAPPAECKWDPRLAARTVDDVLHDEPGPDGTQRAILAEAIAPLRDLDAARIAPGAVVQGVGPDAQVDRPGVEVGEDRERVGAGDELWPRIVRQRPQAGAGADRGRRQTGGPGQQRGQREPVAVVGLLVIDRASRTPDRALARAVCERMRRLGIVVQPTGDAGNVLKVKPPLCLTAGDATGFVGALDRALTDVAEP